jgi:transcriptional regulator with XRE-family HTH domain
MARKKDNFGMFLKSLRLRAGYGLRRFADLIEMPASNLCDIEHGRRRLPKEYLEKTAEALGLEQSNPDWERFFELARKDDELPADVQRIAHKRLIPALLRTIDNVQLSDKDINNLIEDIQGRKHIKDGSI